LAASGAMAAAWTTRPAVHRCHSGEARAAAAGLSQFSIVAPPGALLTTRSKTKRVGSRLHDYLRRMQRRPGESERAHRCISEPMGGPESLLRQELRPTGEIPHGRCKSTSRLETQYDGRGGSVAQPTMWSDPARRVL
jgi:hypothetical protein